MQNLKFKKYLTQDYRSLETPTVSGPNQIMRGFDRVPTVTKFS